MSVAEPWISVEEYLRTERESSVKHEYVGGRLYAMTGTSQNHNRVALALRDALMAAADASGCEVFVSDLKVRVADDRFYYPDVAAVCGAPSPDPYTLTSPCLVVEVLSPSTRSVDLREKRWAYAQMSSLHAYVLVEPDEPWGEVSVRAEGARGWTSLVYGTGQSFALPCPSVTVAVDDLYRRTRP